MLAVCEPVCAMKKLLDPSENGKLGYILLWALGVPVPILLLIYFLKGCD
jgi:hypothetical protein